MLRSNREQAGHFRKKLKRNRRDMNSLTSIIITIMNYYYDDDNRNVKNTLFLHKLEQTYYD
jgi:hypothetical protein